MLIAFQSDQITQVIGLNMKNEGLGHSSDALTDESHVVLPMQLIRQGRRS